jgi:phospholipid transport system substrate-binding protein
MGTSRTACGKRSSVWDTYDDITDACRFATRTAFVRSAPATGRVSIFWWVGISRTERSRGARHRTTRHFLILSDTAEFARRAALTGHGKSLTRRQGVLRLVTATLLTAAMRWRLANADPTRDAPPTVPVEQLDDAFLAAMKGSGSEPFTERYRTLAPVIEQVFNLETLLATSIGLAWATLPGPQKAVLAAVFRRYIVSSYVANFDNYNGQSFRVLPAVRAVGNGDVVVQSQLLRIDGPPIALDYVMRRGPDGWQAVDVLMDGSISRVAVQRSDFRELLQTGGGGALAASLERKVANLSGGTLK